MEKNSPEIVPHSSGQETFVATNEEDLRKQLEAEEPLPTEKVKKFPVVELFGPTIQGEGIVAGTKTLFIRFGGCDYRCTKCDSLQAVIPRAIKKYATSMAEEDIVRKVLDLAVPTGTKWVTFSGGNPCMWDVSKLVEMLKELGFQIAVETQGTIWQDWLQFVDVVTVSPKSPGMGEKFEPEKFRNFVEKCKEYQVPTSLKIVVFFQQDLEFALSVGEITEEAGLNNYAYYLSLGNPYPPTLTEDFILDPQGGYKQLPEGADHRLTLLQDYKILCEDLLQDPRFTHWRFLPQLHVLVWHNDMGR